MSQNSRLQKIELLQKDLNHVIAQYLRNKNNSLYSKIYSMFSTKKEGPGEKRAQEIQNYIQSDDFSPEKLLEKIKSEKNSPDGLGNSTVLRLALLEVLATYYIGEKKETFAKEWNEKNHCPDPDVFNTRTEILLGLLENHASESSDIEMIQQHPKP